MHRYLPSSSIASALGAETAIHSTSQCLTALKQLAIVASKSNKEQS